MLSNKKTIILFDGVCNLCNASVNFVIKHDKKRHFLFTSLQSDAGQQLLLQSNGKKYLNSMDSIILIDNSTIYTKSTALIKIAKKLKFPFFLLQIFIVIPKFIRDYIYDLIAKNRYRWFGKKDHCAIPKKEDLARFL